MNSLVKCFKYRKSEGELPVNLINQFQKFLELRDIKLISIHCLQFLDGFPDQFILFQFFILISNDLEIIKSHLP